MKARTASQGQLLSLNAPAKINWFLQIEGKRNDGYHNIVSLVQCISLYDELTFQHADSLEVICDLDIPSLDIPMAENIVYKAAYFLKKWTSCKKGALIKISKKIPVGAGLGGGSSDAAYALIGLNELWRLKLKKRELSSIAAKIGSDVSFFLNGFFALVEGRGDKVTPQKMDVSLILLVVKPPFSVSTPWAYSSYDQLKTSPLTKNPVEIKLILQALLERDFASLKKLLVNDLEEAVCRKYPIISEIKRRLIETGALVSAMSGSGPAVYGVFENTEWAERATILMKPNWCRVVETLV
ncbi:MAG: 4-(cytidine 5'-diphospho)-2-C-methyl-D-erythritol kinase [Nitrospirota bacterium]